MRTRYADKVCRQGMRTRYADKIDDGVWLKIAAAAQYLGVFGRSLA